jgi:hypothetical protein
MASSVANPLAQRCIAIIPMATGIGLSKYAPCTRRVRATDFSPVQRVLKHVPLRSAIPILCIRMSDELPPFPLAGLDEMLAAAWQACEYENEPGTGGMNPPTHSDEDSEGVSALVPGSPIDTDDVMWFSNVFNRPTNDPSPPNQAQPHRDATPPREEAGMGGYFPPPEEEQILAERERRDETFRQGLFHFVNNNVNYSSCFAPAANIVSYSTILAPTAPQPSHVTSEPVQKCPNCKSYRKCMACGGQQWCTHGKLKKICKECVGNQICMHGRTRNSCKECGGSRICTHGKRKEFCKECDGSQLCTHGREKYYCKECKGSGVCMHNRTRRFCRECKAAEPSDRPTKPKVTKLCPHGKKQKYFCKECGGGAYCPHGRLRSFCFECGGSQMCSHKRERRNCRECKQAAKDTDAPPPPPPRPDDDPEPV